MMGGSIFSRGNTLPAGEFNFCYDYIAAKIVINNFKNIIITPWEPTEIIYLRDIHMEEIKVKLDLSYENINKLKLHFVHLILKKYTLEKGGLNLCDLYSAIPAFVRKCVLKYSKCRIDIVIDSPRSNGMCCFRSRKMFSKPYDESIDKIIHSINENGVHIVVELLDELVIMKEYESIFI
jgi:inosine-uridine nucleoside N-ribohydrolase